MNRVQRWARALAWLAAFWGMPLWAAEPVGDVATILGSATATLPGTPVRLLGKGAPIFLGEVVQTDSKGFVLLRFKDGGRITLRPQTTFAVQRLADPARGEGANLRLMQGGIRALTGAVGRGMESRVETAQGVTLGIRGTEFDARICGEDCAQENARLQPVNLSDPGLALGRVARLVGTADVVDSQQGRRPVQEGTPLFAGDEVQTGSQGYVLLALRDGSRIALAAQSRFRLERLQSTPGLAEARFRLARGVARILTGMVVRLAPERYQVATPVATIGVRGTGMDLVCLERCAQDAGQAPTPAMPLHADSGLFVQVWQGRVFMRSPAGEVEVAAGQLFFQPDSRTPAQRQLRPVEGLLPADLPRPDGVTPEIGVLFDVSGERLVAPGVYVWMRQGHIRMQNRLGFLDLCRGEVGFFSRDGERRLRLTQVPEFMAQDPYPLPDAEGDEQAAWYRLLAGQYDVFEQQRRFLCTVE